MPIETRFRITVRLATLANLQGESQRAIEYLDVADRLYEGLSISEGRTRAKEPAGRSKKIRSYLHNATLQRVLALRDVGRDVEAREIAVELSARSNDDISAQSNLILAELAMDRGNLEDLDHYLDGARGAVRRMQERLQQDGLRSPLGIGLRWWNPNSVGVLEGRIRLIQVRKSRRIGLARTQGDAQEAAELFESLGRRRETGLARTQLARFLSDAGDFDRAVFTLEKERTYAEEQGDHLSCFRRTCWLAEACYRQGVCLPTSAAALKTQARAMEFLQNLLYARKKRKTYVEHGEEARMVLALAYWHLGRDVGGLSEARKLRSSVARKKREREGLLEAGLVARFLLLVMSRRCNADALLGLAREARAAHLAIREIEFLAEALVVSDGKKMEVTSRLGDLLNRMGGCWLFFHPRYRDRLTALYK